MQRLAADRVITLALSLVFFYLYLRTVYPIVELPEASQTPNTVTALAPAR
ncbi:MAG: hypothetical protein M3P29_14220 [Acidobacteriota bacterium]|nr:hypothetical protein [Acidobacteriota bacterium]